MVPEMLFIVLSKLWIVFRSRCACDPWPSLTEAQTYVHMRTLPPPPLSEQVGSDVLG